MWSGGEFEALDRAEDDILELELRLAGLQPFAAVEGDRDRRPLLRQRVPGEPAPIAMASSGIIQMIEIRRERGASKRAQVSAIPSRRPQSSSSFGRFDAPDGPPPVRLTRIPKGQLGGGVSAAADASDCPQTMLKQGSGHFCPLQPA